MEPTQDVFPFTIRRGFRFLAIILFTNTHNYLLSEKMGTHKIESDSAATNSKMGRSLCDLWVIFELPNMESSERDGDDFSVPVLSLSFSEWSCESSVEQSPYQAKQRMERSKCKRIELDSPLHPSNIVSSDSCLCTDTNDTRNQGKGSRIKYYRIDRWSSGERNFPKNELADMQSHSAERNRPVFKRDCIPKPPRRIPDQTA